MTAALSMRSTDTCCCRKCDTKSKKEGRARTPAVKIPEAAIARLALRPRHFINYNVVVNSTIEVDPRRNGPRLRQRFVGVGSCKSANSVHGLPSCEDEKFNLVAKVPPTQMRPDKPRNFAQLGHNFFAKVPWIRIRIRWTRACTPLAEDHG